GRDVYGKDCNPELCAAAALYHDASEILTGDLPTPIKYHDDAIKNSYKEIERKANLRLLALLPEELRPAYNPLLLQEDSEISAYVKSADKLSAYIKCIEERKAGNNEFKSAEAQLLTLLENNPLPEVGYFMKNFIPAFELTLDELGTMD
ncbi:MAG: 5'-deoxynucleotidase, partial [Clostridiales bacterium]|nr:5'-deoxynucleotidase [Clostridiales bacterium]